MNWEALGSVAELVGAAAVVATLLYVVRQLDEQSRALHTTVRDSAFQQLQEWNYQIMADPDLADLFQRGAVSEDWAGMSRAEQSRLIHVFYSFFKLFENIYLHSVDGSVDQDVWERNCQVFYAYASQAGCRRYWEKRKPTFDPRFLRLLEGDFVAEMPPGSALLTSRE